MKRSQLATNKKLHPENIKQPILETITTKVKDNI